MSASIDEKVKNIFSPQIQIFEPFGAHVDPSRTNMSSKQLLQVLTSRMNETPFILNKAYKDFSEIKSNFTHRAKYDGTVICTDYNIMFFFYYIPDENGTIVKHKVEIDYIPPVKKLLSQALPLRYTREVGPFKAGDLLFDYTGQTEEGLPKIGYRANVMFASFFGYTAEDAFVCSESFARKAHVDYMEKLYIPITKKFKYLKNENGRYFYRTGENQGSKFTKYLKIEGDLNLDASILNISEEEYGYYLNDINGLEGGKITEVKIHKLTNKPFSDLAKEYFINPELIKEAFEIYQTQFDEYQEIKKKFAPLKTEIPEIDRIVNQIVLSFKCNPKLPTKLINEIAETYKIMDKDIDCVLEIDVHQTVPTTLGDKFANCFAGKGVVSLILPDKYMPVDPEGNKVDIIFNPLGIYGRNNWGMIFETALSKVIRNVEETIHDRELTKDKLTFINENFIKLYDKEYYDKVTKMIKSFDTSYLDFVLNVEKNGFFLFVDNFPGIPYKKFYDNFIKLYAEKFNIITHSSKYTFTKELWNFLKTSRNYTVNVTDEIYDIETEAFFGYTYYLKLMHTAYSKYNSVAQAKSYNRANGQPAKGRKASGGVHCGWQTLNASKGHSEDSSVIQELITLKSACKKDKQDFTMAITYFGEYNLKQENVESQTILMTSHRLALVGLRIDNEGGPTIEISREMERQRVDKRKEKNFNLIRTTSKNIDYDLDKIGDELEFEEYDLDELLTQENVDEKMKSLIEGN